MFELIIFIIIVTFALKSKNKNKKNKPSATPNVPRTKTQVTPNVPRAKTQPTPVPGRTSQVRVQQRPTSNKQVQSKPKEEMSTTERLEAKALADNKKEMVEKQRQRMENKKHYGSHNYAQKYVLGDPVPKGKKMIYCSYCNAENLIPAYSLAKDYNCYFCREEL